MLDTCYCSGGMIISHDNFLIGSKRLLHILQCKSGWQNFHCVATTFSQFNFIISKSNVKYHGDSNNKNTIQKCLAFWGNQNPRWLRDGVSFHVETLRWFRYNFLPFFKMKFKRHIWTNNCFSIRSTDILNFLISYRSCNLMGEECTQP